MAAFNAAELLLAAPLTAARRIGLERKRDEASERWDWLCDAMTVCPAESKRGLLAQLRELDVSLATSDVVRAARLFSLILKGINASCQTTRRAIRDSEQASPERSGHPRSLGKPGVRASGLLCGDSGVITVASGLSETVMDWADIVAMNADAPA